MEKTEQITEARLKSLANLKAPWKKGQAGGGKSPGRPRTANMAEYFREWLENPKNREALTKRMLKVKPDVILHYAEGKPITSIELSGPASGPIQVNTTSEADVNKELTARGVFLPC